MNNIDIINWVVELLIFGIGIYLGYMLRYLQEEVQEKMILQ